MPTLILSDRTNQQQIIPIDGDVVRFGRSRVNELVLPGRGVSRFHGRFVRHGARWVAEDLGARNGIIHGGHRVAVHVLEEGDRLLIGEYTVRYSERGDDSEATGTSVRIDSGSHPNLLAERTFASPAAIHANRLVLLYELSKQLFDQKSTLGLVQVGASALQAELDMEVVAFGLTVNPEGEPEQVILWPPECKDFRLSRSVLSRCLSRKTAVLASEIECPDSILSTDSIRISGTKAVICVPLARDENVCGFIYAASRQSAGPYNTQDLDFASAIGSMVGTAVENARLREMEARKREIDKELAMARKVQQAILPMNWPGLPGWDIYGEQVASQEVSGDYHDAILTADGRLWLVMADVCGKGVSAALLSCVVHAAVHTLADQCSGPRELLSRMNDLLLRRSPAIRFVTCLAILIRPETGASLMSSAGHCRPVYCTSGGTGHAIPVQSHLPLGLDRVDYGESEWQFPRESGCLLLYTDGLSEAFNERNEQFGEQGVLECFRMSSGPTAREIVHAARRHLAGFCGNRELSDDLTLLACCRLASG